MRTLIKLLVVLCFSLLLAGCASLHRPSPTLTEMESVGALKGSLASTIVHKAWDYHKENFQWPDADYLAKHSGLAVYNRNYDNKFSVYILNKPYDPLPPEMDKTQTFFCCFFWTPADSSRYAECRIYYQDGLTPFATCVGDGDVASIWSIQMTVQEVMIRFLKEAPRRSCPDLDRVAIKYAEELSVISPNPQAKQHLFDLCHELLLEYSSIAAQLDPASEAYQAELEGYSDVVARYIFHQEWKK
jgi:hypothetical protein